MNNTGWWGEGEIKFYLDGDDEFPTICGTGTEDYFGGAWDFEYPQTGGYARVHHAVPRHAAGHPAGRALPSQQRFGMYRWHVMDPIRFEQTCA